MTAGGTTSYGGTAGPQVAFNYDNGRPADVELRTDRAGSGNSVNTSYGYDAANRQTTITDQVYMPPVGSGGGTTTRWPPTSTATTTPTASRPRSTPTGHIHTRMTMRMN